MPRSDKKTLELTQGYRTIIDEEDYDRLSKHKWTAFKNRHYIYAHATIKNKQIKIHKIK